MNIDDLTSSLPFILFFLLLALIVGTVAGEKFLYGFLLLVFGSMIILNSNKVAKLFANII